MFVPGSLAYISVSTPFAEYGVVLCELTLNPSELLPLRQMTSVLLKQYVDAHWSADAEKFVPPEATPAAKEAIRRMLPQGLKESISKVGKLMC
jgi:hypothetical protein